MITLSDKLTVLKDGRLLGEEEARATGTDIAQAKKNTLASRILRAHSKASDRDSLLHITFDGLASHDITFVGIIQTARASGLKEFPVPYALTNCHNSLCAVGGTINEDDHLFGLTAAQKYGGNYVPPNLAVIHQYVRETMAGCGRMILGSDSHTRYGALGTMGVGEGGPELVKQLLKRTYDIAEPETVLVWLENAPQPGVGPQDVAVALVGAVFKSGFVKNRVLEFAGPGIANLSVEYRMGIDVMTTETTCLSSIWETDDRVKAYLTEHGRAGDYKKLSHDAPAAFDRCIVIDLAKVPAMMALPFHPSNAYPVTEVIAHAKDIFGEIEDAAHKQFGRLADSFRLRDKIHADGIHVDQGLIAGCAGGSFENLTLAAAILGGKSIGNTPFSLSVYPASEPQAIALVRNGSYVKLMEAGALIKNAFCGPCFGAGDTAPCPSATPPATSRTARAPSPATARSRAWPSWTPAPSPLPRPTPDASPLPRILTGIRSTPISPTISTPISTESAATRAGAGPIPPWNSSTVPTSLTGRPWPLFPRICSSGSPASSPTP